MAKEFFVRLFGRRNRFDPTREQTAASPAHQEIIQPLKETIALPKAFYAIVADDNPLTREDTVWHMESAVDKREDSNSREIVVASGFADLLQKAVSGNAGQQSHVVLLDDEYGRNYLAWLPKIDTLEQIAKTQDVDISPFFPKNRRPEIAGEMPNDLYHPNSINLSIWLRAVGYNGKIFVVSHTVPEITEITKTLARLAEKIPSFDSNALPIDGFADITTNSRGKREYATAPNKSGIWEVKEIKGGLDVALEQLLREE